VIKAKINKIKFKRGEKKILKRNKIKIPDVTKVEEWTKAETGVGAAIAAGNQLENGK
jgi:hypothetical protein